MACRVDLAPPPCMRDHRLNLDTTRCLRCVMRESASNEDVEVLPLVLAASGHASGTFVEIGASTKGDQSLLLEKCFGWRGLLIEGQSQSFKLLNQTQRSCSTRKMQSAVCEEGQGRIEITAVISRCKETGAKRGPQSVCRPTVPCKPLTSLMADAGFPRVNYLVLDVEGAEEIVLKTMQKRLSISELPFDVILVEAERRTPLKNERVRALLRSTGLTQLPMLPSPGSFNDLWVHPRIQDSRSRISREAVKEGSEWLTPVLRQWGHASGHTWLWMNRTGGAYYFTRQVMAAMPTAFATLKSKEALQGVRSNGPARNSAP